MTRTTSLPLLAALPAALLAALLLGCPAPDDPDDDDSSADDDDTADDDTSDDDSGDDDTEESNRGHRYCEILLIYMGSGDLIAEVWGTVGYSDCPAESWEALDPDAIKTEYEALAIKMNGPRYGLADAGELEPPPDAEPRWYGDLQMGLQAILHLEMDQLSGDPYTERTVERTSVFTYWAGSEIYELTAPDGSVYVMISWAQIVDPDLAEEDLAGLGARLELPDDWSFTSRVLDEELMLEAIAEVVVVQDNLENTYQQAVDGS